MENQAKKEECKKCRTFDTFVGQGDAHYDKCMFCGKITKFRWFSFWKRLKGLF